MQMLDRLDPTPAHPEKFRAATAGVSIRGDMLSDAGCHGSGKRKVSSSGPDQPLFRELCATIGPHAKDLIKPVR